MAEDTTPPSSETVKKPRRFAPEPVETTTRSSKKGKEKIQDNGGNVSILTAGQNAGKRRFAPIPVETSFKSSKKCPGNTPAAEAAQSLMPDISPSVEAPKTKPRFAPQLIETTKRSKKASDARPATLPTDKTDLTPGVPNIYTSRPKRIQPDHQDDDASASGLHHIRRAPRRQGSMKPHLNTRRSTREGSFQPELDIIVSSRENSDGDSPPELSGSVESHDSDRERIQLARTRESCDERFSGFILELAAKAAQEQLRKQALELEKQQDMLSAFPNEYSHQIVEHFYGGDSDEDGPVEGNGMLAEEEPSLPRRKSTDKPGGWDLKEMQAHQETLQKLQEPGQEHVNDMMQQILAAQLAKVAALQVAAAEKRQREAEASEQNANDPFWANGNNDRNAQFYTEEPLEDAPGEAEKKAMRKAASPPMLGDDLIFRLCPSPKATKFESDQRVNIPPNRCLNGGGLWGGYCVRSDDEEYMTPYASRAHLIQTPAVERDDPFASDFSSAAPKSPKSPKSREAGVGMVKGIEDRLKAEIARSMQEDAFLLEFDELFITQVYNYLSLGYPSLARQFDKELSKISQISEEELRVDDNKKNAKGYLNISDIKFGAEQPKATALNTNGADKENYCARWKALRIYILEWARQHPNLSNGIVTPSWGVRARRGSWAV